MRRQIAAAALAASLVANAAHAGLYVPWMIPLPPARTRGPLIKESTTPPPANWFRCAEDGGECMFAADVTIAYGTPDRFVKGSFQASQRKIKCDRSSFGISDDPAPFYVKSCWFVVR